MIPLLGPQKVFLSVGKMTKIVIYSIFKKLLAELQYRENLIQEIKNVSKENFHYYSLPQINCEMKPSRFSILTQCLS